MTKIDANTKQPARTRRRRKEARPGEIIDAAIAIFGERGFEATRLEDVARRAGVAKGTLFVYFPSKEDLFRAVAKTVVATNLDSLANLEVNPDLPLAELIPLLLGQAAKLADTGLPAMVRLLIIESRAFPDLARVWHDEVASRVLGLLTAAIERAQTRGEIRPGDPKLHAFSIIGPMLAAVLFREVFKETTAQLPDTHQLALQHAATVLRGLLVSP